MSYCPTPASLLLSLQRALLGEVHAQLREASIEAREEEKLVLIRFEYDGEPSPDVRESSNCAVTEVIAGIPASWRVEDEHIARQYPEPLEFLSNVAYLRAEIVA